MKMSKLLSIHQSSITEHFSDITNNEILGDAFLIHRNPVYKKIREYSLEIGCVYEQAWPKYLILPFQALGEIIACKKIPYVPAASLLFEIEAKRANVLTTDDISVPESHHMHEAAHVIAEYFFQNCHLNNSQEEILKSMICESFANTVDAIAWAYVEESDPYHGIFLNHQSYMHPSRKDIASIKKMVNAYGLRFTFIIMMYSYLHANFLIEKIPSTLIEKLVADFGFNLNVDQKLLKDCDSMMKLAEKLDPQFRIQTTQTYLKLQGYNGDIFQLLDFQFVNLLNTKSEFIHVIKAMTDLVCN